ncbi:MAG: response regulator [Thermodesulfobacteriota bacterium]
MVDHKDEASADLRRSDIRLELSFPVRFQLKDLGTSAMDGEAVDFHAKGICVLTDKVVPRGTVVDLLLFLPSHDKTIRTSARVKWVQRLPGVTKAVRLGMQFPRALDVRLPISCLQENLNQLLHAQERRWHLLRQPQETTGAPGQGTLVPATAACLPAPLGPPRLLVVDDDATLVDNLGGLLADAGFEVTGATTGEQALDLVRRTAFSTALVDLQLPRMSGVEVLRQAKETRPEMEVLVWTEHEQSRSAIDCLNLGACHYFVKPVPYPILKETLERASQRCRRRLATEEAAASFRTLFAHCDQGLVVLSPEGVILAINPCLAGRLSFDPEELTGTPIQALMPEAAPPLCQHLLAADGQPFSLSQSLCRRDGTPIVFQIAGGWVTDADGRPTSAVTLLAER